MVYIYLLMNFYLMIFGGKNGKDVEIKVIGYVEKKGIKNVFCDEGGECVGYIMVDDWLQYLVVDFSNSFE